MARERLDEAVVRLGLVPTRSRGKAMIMAGDVLVHGLPVLQAGYLVKPDDAIALKKKTQIRESWRRKNGPRSG